MDQANFEKSKTPVGRTEKKSPFNNQKMAILGSSANTDKVRTELQNLSFSPLSEMIVDLGNIVPGRLDKMEDITTALQEYDTCVPVFICNATHINTCLPAFIHPAHSVGIIDKNLKKYRDFSSLDLTHTKLLAGQQHCIHCSPAEHSPDNQIRLGKIKTDPQKAEVALRSVDVVIIHLDAIRYGDNIGNEGSLTSGLTIEEACQLAKYAGASTHLKSVVIAGFDENKDVLNMMAKNVALLIYYLIEGFIIRQKEKEYLSKATTFTLMPDELDTEIVFYVNQQSGRWWLEVPSEFDENPILLPCTQKDYEEACQNHISERIMKVFAKI